MSMIFILLALLVLIIVAVLAGIAATLSHHAKKPRKEVRDEENTS